MRDEEHVVYCHVITLQLIVFFQHQQKARHRGVTPEYNEASSEHFLLNATNNCFTHA
jgi:hypothetical protein